jgi:NTE family protein
MNASAKKTRFNHASSSLGSADASVKHVNLALQGGGAHGAFTWGVLDQLLKEPDIAVEGVSATSSGAMNAVVMAHGLAVGGRECAREALDKFWRTIAGIAACFSPLQRSPIDRLIGNRGPELSPSFLLFDIVSLYLSPYQLNPFNYNPIRHVIERMVDFERLRHRSAVKLFLAATNVRTGKVKIFTNTELTADCVLASACLPSLCQAVEVNGEHFWDGGYMGNPALFPLIYSCESSDILVVQINPILRPDVPTTARDIMNRVTEISFNSSLMREMRAVAFVTQLIDDGKLCQSKAKRMLIHSISADDVMCELGLGSRLNADDELLTRLHNSGRERARLWIDGHLKDLGIRSTIDIREIYL